MSTYGYEIVQTLIIDIEPDVNVKRAMNEINAGNIFLFLDKKAFRYIVCVAFSFIKLLLHKVCMQCCASLVAASLFLHWF